MYDLIVIGAGPGGYVAAIKAAQLGLKVACVEKRGALGGTCLNVGCIPSKSLLHSSHLYHEANEHFADHGINCSSKLNLKKMLARKDGIVSGLTKGIEMLFAKNKVDYIKGAASFVSENKLSIKDEKGKKSEIEAKNIIIATGSDVVCPPNIKIDEKKVVSSTGALDLTSVPKHLVVVGGGVIGLELGSVWKRLGAKVTVVEFADRILPAMDGSISKEAQKIFTKQGMEFMLSTKLTNVAAGKSITVESGGKEKKITADTVLIAIGRKPYTDGLNIEAAGISLDEKGRIVTNNNLQTSKPHIYAIGDVTSGVMLAHKAEEEGVFVAELLAGQKPHINYGCIPGIVYTNPEIASVGQTEEELKANAVPYNVGKFPFMANSRARCNGDTDGFVKLLAHKDTDEILGCHIIGPQAGDLIQEIVVGMEYKAASEDIARICHGHPGLSEAVKEAALDTFFKPIHM